MTPLGSAGGSQERVRVVAMGEAISIAGGPPGAINIKYESKLNCYMLLCVCSLPSSSVLTLMETKSLLSFAKLA